MIPIHLAEIKNGTLKYFYPDRLQKWLRQLGDGKIEVIFRKKQNKRSIQQNKYLHAVPYKIFSEDTGMTKSQVHNFFKLQFLKEKVGKYETIGSTSKLSTKEFSQYLEQINNFCEEERGYSIPLPNRVEY